MAAIVGTSVTRVFQTSGASVTALEDANISIGDGEFVSIVGPSGCGKSTLLQLIAGLDKPSHGQIEVYGKPVDRPRRDVGVVFQTPVLFPWRSVEENVFLPSDVQGTPRNAVRSKVSDLLKMAGLEGFEKAYPSQLSGGMQQRVGIVRALVNDPLLLLMDEPFGALDALTRETMNLELQRIWLEKRRTVVFITHSIPEAIFLADRVLVMTPRPGKVRLDLKIDLPRPRNFSMMTDPAFGAYAQEIRSLLDASGRID